MTDYYCAFSTKWRCPDKDIVEGDKPCQIKQVALQEGYSTEEYIESWDCPIAIKEDGDNADHT